MSSTVIGGPGPQPFPPLPPLPEGVIDALRAAVTPDHVSVNDVDRLVYSVDSFWLPQMWMDRGIPPTPPHVIVHPGSAAEVAAVLRIANDARVPVVPWG